MSERPVRQGEELDIARVDAWLRTKLEGLTGTPAVTQYASGASNWTYRLRYDSHDLILRRPPAGTKARSAHDMGREYKVQTALEPVFPWVPRTIALCDDPSILGSDFYVMERLDGVVPGRSLGVEIDRDQAQRLCEQFIETLVALHAVDPDAAGLAHFGKGAGYTRRQVEGWSERYARARTWNVPRGDRIIRWLSANLPAEERICITHNDYRLDNLVLDRDDPTRIVGVLDWELAALGNPWMDVGNLLAYWVEAGDDWLARATRRQPSHLPGMLTRRQICDYYASRSGSGPGDWTFYEVFGLFRLSAIAQQIYYRYHHRETRNPAFRNFWVFVNYLHWRCRKMISAD